MPSGLQQALGPVLQHIAEMTAKIKHYDRLIEQTDYPETQALLSQDSSASMPRVGADGELSFTGRWVRADS
jgi:hypothetical protein